MGKCGATLQVAPESNRWGLKSFATQLHRAEIIVEMWSLATVESLAGPSRKALAVMAYSADVTTVANEKDIGSPIGLLSSPLQPAAPSRKLFPVDVGRNLDDEVDVFRIVSRCADRTNEADSLHTLDLLGEPNEFRASAQEVITMALVSRH